jgi:predicted RNA-binding Zn-ribbon protein involved in translation (DUF1610 family)
MSEPTNTHVASTETAYPRLREDGWPLCPGCGEDELWSNTVPATVETIVCCLRCGWKPLRP